MGNSGDFPESRRKSPKNPECALQDAFTTYARSVRKRLSERMSPAPVLNISEDTAKVGTKYDLSIGSDGDKSRQIVINIFRQEV